MLRKLGEVFERFGVRHARVQDGNRFVRDFEKGTIQDEDIVRFKAGFDVDAQKLALRVALKCPDGGPMEHRNMLVSLEDSRAIFTKTHRSDIVREMTHAYNLATRYYTAALTGGAPNPQDYEG